MQARTAWLLVAPALLTVGVAFLLPFAVLALMSIWSQPPGSLLLDTRPTLSNYIRLLGDVYYLRGLALTIGLSLATVAISLTFALPVAYWIVRRAARWRGFCTALVLVPLVCGALLPALGLVNLFGPLGVVNGALKELGVITTSITFLGNPTGILIGLVQSFLPFAVLPLIAAFDRLSPDLEQAALSLGARPVSVWSRVILPQLAPALLAGGLLVFCAALTSFVTPQILGQGRVAVLGTMIYQQALLVLDWPFASALAVVMLVLLGVSAVIARGLARATTGSR